MTFLLDVNVLIALIDTTHVANGRVQDWFVQHSSAGWATCPLTENGAIRIVSASRYPNSQRSPGQVVDTLGQLCALPGHQFWSDDLSLLSSDRLDASRLATSAQVTDTYLLALAASRGGKLATLDRRLVTTAVRGGDAALHLIG